MTQENTTHGTILVISGPAGSGKDTLISLALQSTNVPFERVLTTTSRPQREGEQDGREYRFLSSETFKQRIERGAFVEYALGENGSYYGVQKEDLDTAMATGKNILWKVDWKGVEHIKSLYPQAISICIMAPAETLERRLRSREGNRYPESYFQERALYAQQYFSHLAENDYVIWNEDNQLSESLGKLEAILTKITRQEANN